MSAWFQAAYALLQWIPWYSGPSIVYSPWRDQVRFCALNLLNLRISDRWIGSWNRLGAATPDQKFKSSHKLRTTNISLSWNGSLGYESSPMVSLYLEVKFTMMLCHDCWPSSKYKRECYFHPKLFLQLPWIVSALELRRNLRWLDMSTSGMLSHTPCVFLTEILLWHCSQNSSYCG